MPHNALAERECGTKFLLRKQHKEEQKLINIYINHYASLLGYLITHTFNNIMTYLPVPVVFFHTRGIYEPYHVLFDHTCL